MIWLDLFELIIKTLLCAVSSLSSLSIISSLKKIPNVVETLVQSCNLNSKSTSRRLQISSIWKTRSRPLIKCTTLTSQTTTVSKDCAKYKVLDFIPVVTRTAKTICIEYVLFQYRILRDAGNICIIISSNKTFSHNKDCLDFDPNTCKFGWRLIIFVVV